MESSIQNGHSGPAPLLCLGMARTGTASLTEALKILGIRRVHHGLDMSPVSSDWDILDLAADATFPVLPTYTNTSFSRQGWNEWCRDWDAVTDIASFYATSLIPAFPDAKVIIVEREFESWFRSWTRVAKTWASSPQKLQIIKAFDRRLSIKPSLVAAKFQLGWIGSTDIRHILDKEKVREAYHRHYAYIRRTVPKDQLLDFKLVDGWGPLCAFLEKPIPDRPFPHINDSKAFEEFVKVRRKEGLRSLAKTFLPGGRRRVALENQREAAKLTEAKIKARKQDQK